MNTLKYVRPGNGYVPNFEIFGKVEANGERSHPLYNDLKKAAPGDGHAKSTWLPDTSPGALSVVGTSGSDVTWNFEKVCVVCVLQVFCMLRLLKRDAVLIVV